MPEVNYVPDPRSPWIAPTVYHGDLNASGQGDPNGQVVAWPGASYLDTATGDRWSKASGEGTATGWTADGGGGGPTIVSSAPTLDPGNDPKTAYNPATGEFWVWSGTAWDLLLG